MPKTIDKPVNGSPLKEAGGHAKPTTDASADTGLVPVDTAALARRSERLLMGVFLFGLGGLLLYLLVALWPAVEPLSSATRKPKTITPFGLSYAPDANTALLLVVLVASALGSFVHTATSFSDYVGNRRFVASWTWWYLLRVFIGAALALLFYFALRGGFLSATSSPKDINPYGIAAVAGLVGLFSKQATDKLREIFETMFRVGAQGGDTARGDSLVNPRPQITAVRPLKIEVGSTRLEVAVDGSGYVRQSVASVRRKGTDRFVLRKTSVLGTGELSLQLLESDVTSAGTLLLEVSNPPPGGGTSAMAVIDVVD